MKDVRFVTKVRLLSIDWQLQGLMQAYHKVGARLQEPIIDFYAEGVLESGSTILAQQQKLAQLLDIIKPLARERRRLKKLLKKK